VAICSYCLFLLICELLSLWDTLRHLLGYQSNLDCAWFLKFFHVFRDFRTVIAYSLRKVCVSASCIYSSVRKVRSLLLIRLRKHYVYALCPRPACGNFLKSFGIQILICPAAQESWFQSFWYLISLVYTSFAVFASWIRFGFFELVIALISWLSSFDFYWHFSFLWLLGSNVLYWSEIRDWLKVKNLVFLKLILVSKGTIFIHIKRLFGLFCVFAIIEGFGWGFHWLFDIDGLIFFFFVIKVLLGKWTFCFLSSFLFLLLLQNFENQNCRILELW